MNINCPTHVLVVLGNFTLTGDGGGHTAPQHAQGVCSNLLRGSAVLAVSTGGHHGGLKEHALEKDLCRWRSGERDKNRIKSDLLNFS